MPRGKLNEKTVQQAAVNWLTSYYTSKLDIHSITSELEVGISKHSKHGRGRADGLIVAMLADKTIFTASLEAKSSRTFHNINPVYLDKKWIIHAIIIGLFVLVLFAVLGWTFMDHWFWKWIFPLIMFFVGGFVFLMLSFDNKYYRPIDVISQVKRYPANEYWIALSTDVFRKLPNDKINSLMKDCKKEGIGLIRVSTISKITMLQTPKTTIKQRLNYLDCYSRGEILLKRLETENEIDVLNQTSVSEQWRG